MGFVAEHKADQREKDNWHWCIDVDRIRDSANLTAQEADDWGWVEGSFPADPNSLKSTETANFRLKEWNNLNILWDFLPHFYVSHEE